MNNIIKYSKANGTGNNFIIVIDEGSSKTFSKAFIQEICNYKSNNRYDGFIVVSFQNQLYHLDYYNCDGSWESLCINGLRCVAAILNKKNLVDNKFVLSAGDGMHKVNLADLSNISVSMHKPVYVKKDISVFGCKGNFINSGAKHFVTKSSALLHKSVLNLGKKIRHSKVHFPYGANVNFYKVVKKNIIEIMTYEKGIEDVVLSCASGAVAACYDAHQNDLIESPCKVKVLGGVLFCNFNADWSNVWLSGPVEIEAMDIYY